jgi:hypothetical protein
VHSYASIITRAGEREREREKERESNKHKRNVSLENESNIINEFESKAKNN